MRETTRSHSSEVDRLTRGRAPTLNADNDDRLSQQQKYRTPEIVTPDEFFSRLLIRSSKIRDLRARQDVDRESREKSRDGAECGQFGDLGGHCRPLENSL